MRGTRYGLRARDGILVLAAAVGVVTWCAGCKRKQAAYVPPPPPEVTVDAPQAKTVPQVLDFTGTIRGIEAVEVRARVRGFIIEKHVRDGQRVKKDDVLYKIDPRPFEAMVAQNQAQVASRRAALRLAEVTLTRTTEAVNRQAAAQLELDRATAEKDSAVAALQLAEAQLRQSELDLEWTQVKSPIDGRVGISQIEVGQLVGASEPTLLATVINDRTVLATYFIGERQVLELRRANQNRRPGEDGRALIPVRMALANDADFVHEGVYKWGDNTINPQTGTIRIEAEFQNQDGTIVPGSFVRLRSFVGEQASMLVPDVAVQRDANGAFLLVVGKDNKVERRNVQVGQVIERRRVILAQEGGDFGIAPEDRVIVNGLQRARPGAEVKPVPANAPAAGAGGAGNAGSSPQPSG